MRNAWKPSTMETGRRFVLATTTWKSGRRELLGEQQSGQMTEIGLAMYLDMWAAAQALKEGRTPSLDSPGARLKLSCAAGFPAEAYVCRRTRPPGTV